jgi:type VI secretion system secreted protein VgrG
MATGTGFETSSRFLRVRTAPWDEKFLLRSFSGKEAISQLFAFDLELLSEDRHVRFDDLIGQKLAFSIQLADGETERYFHGYVSSFAQLPDEGRLARYLAKIVPWPWFLTKSADCRIHQNKSVPEIVTDTFQRMGFSDYKLNLRGEYGKWEYCVQYRETAFQFISRLLEQEGIHYFFQHEKDRHIMVLADSKDSNRPCPVTSRVDYQDASHTSRRMDEDEVTDWQVHEEIRSGKYAMTDYNFETPSRDLSANINSVIQQGGNQQLEQFDYPGEYETHDDAQAWIRLRIEEEETSHRIINGESFCRTFVSGYRFDLKRHPRADQNDAYLLTSVSHMASAPTAHSASGTEEPAHYSNTFTAIPYSVPFRPPRVTRRPWVQGCQTAVVVGPPGEEIYVDKHGRIKVQFHWDRVGRRDEGSSCWIRVSQPWAGKGFGGVWIPRIGQEVIISFLEGDPDRPIITGRVYNAEQMPPWDLPANKTQSGFRSSTVGGGADNHNAIRFEDKQGQEELYIHAEKDWNNRINHDNAIHVGNNESLNVGGSRMIAVGGSQVTTVKGSQTIKVGGARSEVIGGAQMRMVKGSQSETIGAAKIVTVGGAEAHKAGSIQMQSGGAIIQTSGAAYVVKSGGTLTITSGAAISITAPLINISASTILMAGNVLVGGVLIAKQGVIAPNYSPGIGNFK